MKRSVILLLGLLAGCTPAPTNSRGVAPIRMPRATVAIRPVLPVAPAAATIYAPTPPAAWSPDRKRAWWRAHNAEYRRLREQALAQVRREVGAAAFPKQRAVSGYRAYGGQLQAAASMPQLRESTVRPAIHPNYLPGSAPSFRQGFAPPAPIQQPVFAAPQPQPQAPTAIASNTVTTPPGYARSTPATSATAAAPRDDPSFQWSAAGRREVPAPQYPPGTYRYPGGAYYYPNQQQAEREEQPDPQVAVVYITNTGHRFHLAGCQYLAHSSRAVRLDDALSSGYTACSRCFGGGGSRSSGEHRSSRRRR